MKKKISVGLLTALVCTFIFLLIVTYESPVKIGDVESGTEENSTGSSEESNSNVKDEQKPINDDWKMDFMDIDENVVDIRNNGSIDEVRDKNGVTLYMSNISWVNGSITTEEFKELSLVAAKLYRDKNYPGAEVSVRCLTEDELSQSENKVYFSVGEDYSLALHIYMEIKDGEEIKENGEKTISIIYDVNHLVLK